jgi:hypothetical protein
MMHGQQNANLDGNEIGVGVKAEKTIHIYECIQVSLSGGLYYTDNE